MSNNASLTSLATLHTFVPERVLSEGGDQPIIRLLGHFQDRKDQGAAIVSLAKTSFNASSSKEYCNGSTLTLVFENDVYYQYSGSVSPELNQLKVDIIFPATDRHIKKYTAFPKHYVRETSEQYQLVHKPQIVDEQKVDWVYNILDKKAEVERLLFEDDLFMLHPDLKWTQTEVTDLYCVGLCKRRDIGSLRDLTSEHLPLLRRMRDAGVAFLAKRFNVPPSHLRLYVHYPPSYYHFHVHYTSTQYNPPGSDVCRAHLLDDIIDNIEQQPNYYETRTLSLQLAENHPLWVKLKSCEQEQRPQP